MGKRSFPLLALRCHPFPRGIYANFKKKGKFCPPSS